DPNGNVWSAAYDSMGRLKSRTDPLGLVTNYSYDARNRVSSIVSPEGTTTLTYDAAGDLTRSQYSDGTELQFTYDDNSRLTSGNGVQIGYDAAGRIVRSNGLAITRDAAGRIVSIAYPQGIVAYTYDQRGLLSRISDWAGGGMTIGYNEAREMISMERSNGTKS